MMPPSCWSYRPCEASCHDVGILVKTLHLQPRVTLLWNLSTFLHFSRLTSEQLNPSVLIIQWKAGLGLAVALPKQHCDWRRGRLGLKWTGPRAFVKGQALQSSCSTSKFACLFKLAVCNQAFASFLHGSLAAPRLKFESVQEPGPLHAESVQECLRVVSVLARINRTRALGECVPLPRSIQEDRFQKCNTRRWAYNILNLQS